MVSYVPFHCYQVFTEAAEGLWEVQMVLNLAKTRHLISYEFSATSHGPVSWEFSWQCHTISLNKPALEKVVVELLSRPIQHKMTRW